MDKDRRVSIETISAVWVLHTQIFTRNWRCGRFAPSLFQGCSEKTRKKDVVMTAGRADQFRFCSSWCSGDLLWKLDLLLWPRDQETEFPVEACWLSQTQESQTEEIHPQTFDDPFFWQHWHDLDALDSHWTDSRRRLLRRRLEFHASTFNKSAHTKKVWKLKAPCIYIIWQLCMILTISLNGFMASQMCYIIWRELNICDRAIIWNNYRWIYIIFYIYLIALMLICNLWFNAVFIWQMPCRI